MPEERIITLTKDIEEYMKKGVQVQNKKLMALKSLEYVNYKIFIPMIPKLTFGKNEYQLKPLFPNYDVNNVDQPYILIKSYKPQKRSYEDSEYKDCSGCEPQLVEYCKNCGRVLVNGKHPSKSQDHDNFGTPPPNSINLKRELVHLLYTEVHPYIFFITFISSLFGAEGFWKNPEEKMSFFIGSITNKFIQFKDGLREELQNLLGFKK